VRAPPELLTIVPTWHPEKILDLRIQTKCGSLPRAALFFIGRGCAAGEGERGPAAQRTKLLWSGRSLLLEGPERSKGDSYAICGGVVLHGDREERDWWSIYTINGLSPFSDMPVDDLHLIQAYILDRA